ncbi:Hypothetical predicted protein [Paramuricea clavata]|uniref:Uncharacterized protein n=1 Tax=Paramuricea clavata TaxID=317549 RepID=A0A6S7FQ52_PARCT|nr:Hypothetical predicted protein [Paramuricea clavata]
MSSDALIHITIYLENECSENNKDKYTPSYEVSEDNSDQMIFSQHIFPEAFADWLKDGGHIIDVSPLDIRTRLTVLKQSQGMTSYVESKINRIADYIENNIEKYIGVVVVF